MDTTVSVERWEADEYIVVVSGVGPVGQTLRKQDADVVAAWLRTALRELTQRTNDRVDP